MNNACKFEMIERSIKHCGLMMTVSGLYGLTMLALVLFANVQPRLASGLDHCEAGHVPSWSHGAENSSLRVETINTYSPLSSSNRLDQQFDSFPVQIYVLVRADSVCTCAHNRACLDRFDCTSFGVVLSCRQAVNCKNKSITKTKVTWSLSSSFSFAIPISASSCF